MSWDMCRLWYLMVHRIRPRRMMCTPRSSRPSLALLALSEGYPLAFRRFAQDAFIRFDSAFLAAALIGFRARFFAALG